MPLIFSFFFSFFSTDIFYSNQRVKCWGGGARSKIATHKTSYIVYCILTTESFAHLQLKYRNFPLALLCAPNSGSHTLNGNKGLAGQNILLLSECLACLKKKDQGWDLVGKKKEKKKFFSAAVSSICWGQTSSFYIQPPLQSHVFPLTSLTLCGSWNSLQMRTSM